MNAFQRRVARVVVTTKPLTTLPRRAPASTRSTPMATVKSLDHIVLTVEDIEATASFYTAILGMRHETFTHGSQTRHALSFGNQRINLHKSGAEFEPKASNVQSGSGDLCFITEDAVDDVVGKLKDAKIVVLEGGEVVDRTGAQGPLRSVYLRDPDGNLVEISNHAKKHTG